MRPIFPEIFTPDYTLRVVDNGNGTISIIEGQKFQIQDVVIDTTGRPDLTFSVESGKTYHLRYSLNGRPINSYIPHPNSFYLVDVTDTNYNPNGVDESDIQFDTKYDDMLIAKIVVDSNGTVTIISLKNRRYFNIRIQGYIYWGSNSGQQQTSITLNLGRKIYPKLLVKGFSDDDDSTRSDWTLWLDAGNLPDEGWKIGKHISFILTGVIAWSATRYECTIIANTAEHYTKGTGDVGLGTPFDAVRFDLIVEG